MNAPNDKDYPDVQNCIVYYNNSGGKQLSGFSANDFAHYCCIQDCNEVNDNHNDEPGFAYTVDANGTPDPENYHLAHDAFCKDKANPSLAYDGQVDMDGEGIDRKYGDEVDIGADEVYDCHDDYLSEADVYNELDLNADGIVNMWEFNLLSAAWETYEPNELIPPVDCDFNGDWHVDTGDLVILAEDWLWIACWKLEELTEAMAMSGGGESMMMSIPAPEPAITTEPAPEPAPEPEPVVEPEPMDPQEVLDFLDAFWQDDLKHAGSIDKKTWEGLIDSLERDLFGSQ